MKKQLVSTLLLAVAANAELVSRGENTGIGARAVSMGEAFTAVADDYSALYYNPAGMTQLSRSELGLNLDYRLRANATSLIGGIGSRRAVETARLGAISMVLTSGNGIAFGLGYYSPTSFDDPLQYFVAGREYAYEASGNMDHYRAAVAYAPSTRASLGFAVSVLAGKEQLEIRDGITARYLEEYAGFNLEPSFLFYLSKAVTLGGSAVVAERLALRDTYQEQGQAPVETHYSIRNPVQTRLGIAFQKGWTLLSADWHAVLWQDYAYAEEGGAFLQGDSSYSNRHVFALGLEQRLSRRGPVLRAGVSWEAEDASSINRAWAKNPASLHLGFGLPVSQFLMLDLGYQYRGATSLQPSTAGGPADLTIAETGQQVMGSLRFRW